VGCTNSAAGSDPGDLQEDRIRTPHGLISPETRASTVGSGVSPQPSRRQVPAHVAQDLGIHKEALRQWVRQADADSGRRRNLLKTDEREELKKLRKENAELRRANAILKDASVYFAQELDPTRRR
jgi:transposase